MTIGQTYLREFDEEMALTRKYLERVPSDKGQWKPHPKSFPFGHLAQLVAWIPGWIAQTLQRPFIDLAVGSGYSYKKTEELLKMFDDNVAAARKALETTPDKVWGEEWMLKQGEMVLWKAPRNVVVRNHISHLVHHRAQLGMYLRLIDVPVPASYGPSADERTF